MALFPFLRTGPEARRPDGSSSLGGLVSTCRVVEATQLIFFVGKQPREGGNFMEQREPKATCHWIQGTNKKKHIWAQGNSSSQLEGDIILDTM